MNTSTQPNACSHSTRTTQTCASSQVTSRTSPAQIPTRFSKEHARAKTGASKTGASTCEFTCKTSRVTKSYANLVATTTTTTTTMGAPCTKARTAYEMHSSAAHGQIWCQFSSSALLQHHHQRLLLHLPVLPLMVLLGTLKAYCLDVRSATTKKTVPPHSSTPKRMLWTACSTHSHSHVRMEVVGRFQMTGRRFKVQKTARMGLSRLLTRRVGNVPSRWRCR